MVQLLAGEALAAVWGAL